ncbi:MAG: Fur family transcriptional regulator [Myxococcota bacterium]|nr:Fur family transcriptional regulator [Myxococcota bacterium]
MSMNNNEARKLLRESGLRVTAPRLAVLQILSAAESPLSYSEVLERLGENDWDPATIYRNLVKLRDAHVASVVSRAEGIDRYALLVGHGDGHLHPHFVCESCGKMACISLDLTLSSEMDQSWSESIRQAMIQLRGACPECLVN